MNLPTTQEHVCSHRHAFALDNFLRRLIQSPKRIAGEYIKEGYTVIDLGCGPGFFTIPMAELVGRSGRVYAVDLQKEMLAKLSGKLIDQELAARITLHQCRAHSLDLDSAIVADFVLGYYMVHETPDKASFFAEVRKTLKPGGKMLIVEPPFHVNRESFKEIIKIAEQLGFGVVDRPKRKGGLSVLLS